MKFIAKRELLFTGVFDIKMKYLAKILLTFFFSPLTYC